VSHNDNPPPLLDTRPFRQRLADRLFQPRYAGRSALTAVSAAMLVGIACVLAIAVVLIWMNSQKFLPAEIAIALVVILGALVLVLCVACLSIVLKRLALADRRYAMGLPEGSIRAILALMLVLLFGVVSVFLVGSAQRGGSEGRRIENLSTSQADAIPIDQILSRVETRAGSGLYNLVLVSAPNPGFDDLSKQLLTTLATLVVAIAAFYFGASTVTNAVETVRPKVPLAPGGEGAAAPDGTAAEQARKAQAAEEAEKAARETEAKAKQDEAGRRDEEVRREEEARRLAEAEAAAQAAGGGQPTGGGLVDDADAANREPADHEAADRGGEPPAAADGAGDRVEDVAPKHADPEEAVEEIADEEGLQEPGGRADGLELGEGPEESAPPERA